MTMGTMIVVCVILAIFGVIMIIMNRDITEAAFNDLNEANDKIKRLEEELRQYKESSEEC